MVCGLYSDIIWFEDLYDYLLVDIVFCVGDWIIVEEDICSFIVFGVIGM